MNGSEASQERVNMQDAAGEVGRAGNTELEKQDNEIDVRATGFDRTRAGVIGSAALAGNVEAGGMQSGGELNKAELNVERVEQMVAAENALGEEQRSEAVPTMMATPAVQIQGKVDKVAVKALEGLVSREGNTPGKLNEEVNRLRREYLANWRAQG